MLAELDSRNSLSPCGKPDDSPTRRKKCVTVQTDEWVCEEFQNEGHAKTIATTYTRHVHVSKRRKKSFRINNHVFHPHHMHITIQNHINIQIHIHIHINIPILILILILVLILILILILIHIHIP